MKNKFPPIVFFMFLFYTLSLLSCKSTTPKSIPTTTVEPISNEIIISPTIIQNPRFDPTVANQVPPEKILEEISFITGGGGAFCFAPPPPYSKPTIVFKPKQESEALTLIQIIACGWQENEEVIGSILYPDGKKIVENTQSGSDIYFQGRDIYSATITFMPHLDDPEGIYTFVLEGISGKVSIQIEIHKPIVPRMYQINDTLLFLYGFTPRENIKLYGYLDSKFSGWDSYTVDEYGQLTIEIPNNKYMLSYYTAIGAVSGEVPLHYDGIYNYGPLEKSIFSTPNCGGLRSQFRIGDFARVAFTDGSNMRIRAAAGFNQEILYKVPEGTIVTITGGPECANNSTWWEVLTEDGLAGWMTQEQNGEYLLWHYP